jgi:hypothetical protein
MYLNARQADIDLTVNIAPLLRLPQSTHQLFEGVAMFRCIFKPREEVRGHRSIFNPNPVVLETVIAKRDIAFAVPDREEAELVLFALQRVAKDPSHA